MQINMLNGIYAPTSGDAQVYGRSVSTQMANIRGMIGNCFQHDVLYLELTVKQHVAMYARLKGIPHTEVDAKVSEILGTVGLLDKLHFNEIDSVVTQELSSGKDEAKGQRKFQAAPA